MWRTAPALRVAAAEQLAVHHLHPHLIRVKVRVRVRVRVRVGLTLSTTSTRTVLPAATQACVRDDWTER